MSEEFRRAIRVRIIKEIFGEEWRPDRPLDNIGAELEILMNGGAVNDFADYQRRAGKFAGLLRALDLIDEEFRALYAPTEGQMKA